MITPPAARLFRDGAEMKITWKTELKFDEFAGRSTVMLPVGAEILDIQMHEKVPHLWALVDPAQPLQTRTLELSGTGDTLPDAQRRHLATVQTEFLDMHFFELLE